LSVSKKDHGQITVNNIKISTKGLPKSLKLIDPQAYIKLCKIFNGFNPAQYKEK